jgi:hypothetical protein
MRIRCGPRKHVSREAAYIYVALASLECDESVGSHGDCTRMASKLMDVIKVYTTEYCCDGSLERWTCDDAAVFGVAGLAKRRSHQALFHFDGDKHDSNITSEECSQLQEFETVY